MDSTLAVYRILPVISLPLPLLLIPGCPSPCSRSLDFFPEKKSLWPPFRPNFCGLLRKSKLILVVSFLPLESHIRFWINSVESLHIHHPYKKKLNFYYSGLFWCLQIDQKTNEILIRISAPALFFLQNFPRANLKQQSVLERNEVNLL